MGRLHVLESALSQSGAPLNIATVNVYQPGTTTPLSLGLLFAGPTGATTIAANPIVTGANGAIEFWLDDSTGVTDVDLRVVHPNVTTFTTRWQPHVQAQDAVTVGRTQTITGAKTFTNVTITGGTASGFSFSLSDGTVVDPPAKFTLEPTTGAYRPVGGGFGLTVQGVARMIATTSSVTFYKGSNAALEAIGGSVGSPITPATRTGGAGSGGGHGTINTDVYVASAGYQYQSLWASAFSMSGVGGHIAGAHIVAEVPNGSTWTAWNGSAYTDNSCTGLLVETIGRNRGVSARGINVVAYMETGDSTLDRTLAGMEINVTANAAVTDRYAILIGATATGVSITPSGNDAAIALTGKIPAVGFMEGIRFAPPNFPTGSPTSGVIFNVRAAGALIRANGTNQYPSTPGANASVAYGVDFTNMTFTTFAFVSNGFSVAPSGLVSAAGVTLPSGNVLVSAGNLTVSAGTAAVSGSVQLSTATSGTNVAGNAIQIRESSGTYRNVVQMGRAASADYFALGNVNLPCQMQVFSFGIFTKATTPAIQQVVNAACTDLATAVALVNQIRTALINFGYCA